MNIQQLSAADAGAYRELRLYSLQESPAAFGSSYEEEVDRPLETVAKRLADGDNHIFGALSDEGDLRGTITLRRDTHVKGAHRAYVYAMYVLPQYRRQGVGRALMEAVIARARELGLSWISLQVNQANEEAVRLYESCGFEMFGLEKDAFRIGDDRYDAAYMALRLR